MQTPHRMLVIGSLRSKLTLVDRVGFKRCVRIQDLSNCTALVGVGYRDGVASPKLVFLLQRNQLDSLDRVGDVKMAWLSSRGRAANALVGTSLVLTTWKNLKTSDQVVGAAAAAAEIATDRKTSTYTSFFS